MTNAPLSRIEEEILAHLRQGPAILVDIAARLKIPVAAASAIAHRLQRQGLVEARLLGRPPILHWMVVA